MSQRKPKMDDESDSLARYISQNISQTSSFFRFVGEDILTPQFLIRNIGPFLLALDNLASIITEIRTQVYDLQGNRTRIKSISQRSPISIQMEGVGEALTSVQEFIIPWKRRHAQKIAELLEMQKKAEVAQTQAQLVDIRLKSAHTRVETKLKEEEVEQRRLENERMKLENERMKLDIEHQRLSIEAIQFEQQKQHIELIMEMLKKLSPSLSGEEVAAYVVRLLPTVKFLIESPLEATDISVESSRPENSIPPKSSPPKGA